MLRDVSQYSFLHLEPLIWSVSDLNRHMRVLVESDYRLQDIWVSGEISNLSRPASGHMYFTLKDESASLRCVMWRPDVARLTRSLRDGEAVEVHGRISVYEAGGLYQLYADQIRPSGMGMLFQEFLRRKELLEREGLFAPERKRPLPPWPRRIGVVTSPSAAALRDVVNVLRRRFPLVELILVPTPVQGEEAPDKIVEALETMNQVVKPDVILVVRGGGSMEDLWAFNDVSVVRAIAMSEIPVVSGIGHETDIILADFAADVRAPTPSAAAEIATPDREELLDQLLEMKLRMERLFAEQLRGLRWELEDLKSALIHVSPRALLLNAQQQVDDLTFRLSEAVRHQLALRRASIEGITQTLRVVDPSAVLNRGFALVSREDDGSLVRSVLQVEGGDRVRVQVSDGVFGAEVAPSKGKEI
jgi:exodeoxyribonuclease VII large subunit